MAAKITLSENLIEVAKANIVKLINNDDDKPIILEQPYSNFKIVLSDKEPKNSFYEFAPDELPGSIDLKGKSVFIVSDNIV